MLPIAAAAVLQSARNASADCDGAHCPLHLHGPNLKIFSSWITPDLPWQSEVK